MRILFTGASSFTGCWFVRRLAAAGHEVFATFRAPAAGYEGVRRERVELVHPVVRAAHGCRFGDAAFLTLIRSQPRWDLLCHHAADVTEYKSPDFDVAAAVAGNTRNLRNVLAALAERDCRSVLLTGSVFEGGEGAGSEGLPPFSPYGLSKQLTAEVFRYFTPAAGMRLGKFVIPNPFGPLEEPRFTAYLLRTWAADDVATVKTPAYIRDNIHVSLLARAYVAFAEQLCGRCEASRTSPRSSDSAEPSRPATAADSTASEFVKYNPSGYIESQGAFAERFAAAMRTRLGLSCRLDLTTQTDFSEPRIRINTDALEPRALGWDERAAWDEIAAWYGRRPGVRR